MKNYNTIVRVSLTVQSLLEIHQQRFAGDTKCNFNIFLKNKKIKTFFQSVKVKWKEVNLNIIFELQNISVSNLRVIMG